MNNAALFNNLKNLYSFIWNFLNNGFIILEHNTSVTFSQCFNRHLRPEINLTVAEVFLPVTCFKLYKGQNSTHSVKPLQCVKKHPWVFIVCDT